MERDIMLDIVESESEKTMDERRIRGTVKKTFPERGFCWLAGEDGTDYFGHATHIQFGVDLFTAWIGQPCTFVPHQNGPDNRGPFAEAIILSEGNA
jgi:hypothetical protein